MPVNLLLEFVGTESLVVGELFFGKMLCAVVDVPVGVTIRRVAVLVIYWLPTVKS